jgi:glutaredoxin 2
MLPILAHDQGAMNESLDIIAFLDKENSLQVPSTIKREDFKLFEQLLNQIGEPVHSMAMPYWIYTPEFSPEARVYFQKKKEMKRGPFKDLVKNRRKFEEQLNPLLNEVEKKLCPFFESQHFSLKDILIASHLWGLYIVPEFQFSEKLHHYLQEVKTICHFDYHQDFWR